MGYVSSLFETQTILKKKEFIRRAQKSECIWIFDEQAIRKRMNLNFTNVDMLSEIEENEKGNTHIYDAINLEALVGCSSLGIILSEGSQEEMDEGSQEEMHTGSQYDMDECSDQDDS